MDKRAQVMLQKIKTLKIGIISSNELNLKYLDELAAIIQEPEQPKARIIEPPLAVWGNERQDHA